MTDSSFATVFSAAAAHIKALLFPHQEKDWKCFLCVGWSSLVCFFLLSWVIVTEWKLIKSDIRPEKYFCKYKDSHICYKQCNVTYKKRALDGQYGFFSLSPELATALRT